MKRELAISKIVRLRKEDNSRFALLPFIAFALLLGSYFPFFFTTVAAPLTQAISANRIAFVSIRGNTTSRAIYTMRADGSDVQLFMPPNVFLDVGEPMLSPNGSTIAFTAYNGNETNIYLADLDGFAVVKATQGGGSGPSWSPDGQRLVYSKGSKLSIVDISDSVFPKSGTPLPTGNLTLAYQPAWSPDGTRIAFVGETDEISSVPQIYTVNSDGSNLTPVIGCCVTRPAWSPDSAKLAYNRIESPGDFTANIYTFNLATRTERLLVRDAFEPTWSSDGIRIAFEARLNNNSDVFAINTDGTNLVRLTTNAGEDGQPNWSPAGITPTYQITGRVADRNGRGLEGVQITVGSKVATTDTLGNYTLSDLPAGQVTLVPKKPNSDATITPASIPINLQSDSTGQNFSAACERSPTTRLDSCALLPGDLLLVRGMSTGFAGIDTIWAIERGSYFHHVGMYTGNQEVTEAVGFQDNDADEVVTHPMEQTSWWNTVFFKDWAVIRPKSPPNKQFIVEQIKGWAAADNPIIGYAFSPRTDDTSFYCSKLVWRPYKLVGYDIEQPVWNAWGWTIDPLVTPGDLYNDRSVLVQQMLPLKDYIPVTIAVGPSTPLAAAGSAASATAATTATILVIDPQGKRTGFDPATDTTVSEIPSAIYSGSDAQVQNVSVSTIGTGWKVQVTGAAGGNFRVVAEFPSLTALQPQVIEGTVSPGETKTFTIIPPGKLYLPLVRR